MSEPGESEDNLEYNIVLDESYVQRIVRYKNVLLGKRMPGEFLNKSIRWMETEGGRLEEISNERFLELLLSTKKRRFSPKVKSEATAATGTATKSKYSAASMSRCPSRSMTTASGRRPTCFFRNTSQHCKPNGSFRLGYYLRASIFFNFANNWEFFN